MKEIIRDHLTLAEFNRCLANVAPAQPDLIELDYGFVPPGDFLDSCDELFAKSLGLSSVWTGTTRPLLQCTSCNTSHYK